MNDGFHENEDMDVTDIRGLLSTVADQPARAVDLVPAAFSRYETHRRRTHIAAMVGSAVAVVGIVGAATAVLPAGKAGVVLAAPGSDSSATPRPTSSGADTSATPTSSGSADPGEVTVGSIYAKAASCPPAMIDPPALQKNLTLPPGGAAADQQRCQADTAVLQAMYPADKVYPQVGIGPMSSTREDFQKEGEEFIKLGFAYQVPAGTAASIETGVYLIVTDDGQAEVNIQYPVIGATDQPTGTQCLDTSTNGTPLALADNLSGVYCADEETVLVHDPATGHQAQIMLMGTAYEALPKTGFDLRTFAADPRVDAMILADIPLAYGS
jgi:hypothetical protein